ncbi:MAG: hypothetical protein EOP05_13465 [Proteobacteria bacterium]|nr:MAG: hypothetical protein EOP05_13465 [Pseudomonadota bacterium]
MLLSTLSGCKPKPIDNPEAIDPIYADLNALNAAATAKAEAQKKKIAELDEEVSKLSGRDPDLKRTLHEKGNLERGLKQIEQDALYFEVRATQRRQYDKEAYLKAFREGKPWPDPAEFKEYEEQKKLRAASRDWSERVPKLTGYNKPDPNAKPAKKAEAKPEGEGGAPAAGGGH